jgi:hypothetical protein
MSEAKTISSRGSGTGATLWRYVGIIAAAHVVLIAVLSPGLYWASGPSLQEQLEAGEAALEAQEYDKAKAAFQAVLDKQPEPAPIFVKAAELHRRADRMLRTQGPGGDVKPVDSDTPPPQPSVDQRPTPPVNGQQPNETKPSEQPTRPGELPDFIPPELRLGN